ncbi:MAG TPA: hypothetical protein VL551_12635 [Actinospica sp.]|nr:hypothetical protein [Actinospica sp.]
MAEAKRRCGVNPWLTGRRQLLTAFVRDHLSLYSGIWFSAHDLARVIREQYLHEPPLTASRYGYGRTNVLASILRELRDAGEVESAPGIRKGTTVWRKPAAA